MAAARPLETGLHAAGGASALVLAASAVLLLGRAGWELMGGVPLGPVLGALGWSVVIAAASTALAAPLALALAAARVLDRAAPPVWDRLLEGLDAVPATLVGAAALGLLGTVGPAGLVALVAAVELPATLRGMRRALDPRARALMLTAMALGAPPRRALVTVILSGAREALLGEAGRCAVRALASAWLGVLVLAPDAPAPAAAALLRAESRPAVGLLAVGLLGLTGVARLLARRAA